MQLGNFLKLSKTQYAVVLLIVANIIWGATAPIFKWALADIPPFTLAFLRFFFAVLIIAPFAAKVDLRVPKKDWLKVFMIGFVGVFINIAFYFMGLKITTSINAPIIASAGPIFLMIASTMFLHEKPGIKKIIGACIGLIGVLVIVIIPIWGESLDISLLGNMFFIISTIAAVIHSVILKEIAKDYDPLNLVFWSFVLGSVMFFPMFANDFISGQVNHIGIQGFIGIAYGAIFASCIGYFCFGSAMKYLPASEVGIFTYIDPVVALIIAMPLLGEVPTPPYFFGAFLVFLGIYIAENRIHWHPIHLLSRETTK